MRGHLQRRGGDAWRIKVCLGRSADGRRRYLERTLRGTRRNAEREMARLVVEVDEGRHAAAAPMSFGELLDRWLEVKRASVAPRTIESYEWVAGKYLRPRLGDRKLAALRTMDLDACLRRAACDRSVGADGADLPHGGAPVPRAGTAVGIDRPQSGS